MLSTTDHGQWQYASISESQKRNESFDVHSSVCWDRLNERWRRPGVVRQVIIVAGGG